jgi:arylsulfatase A-like enzyme
MGSPAGEGRPNFIVLFADDLGYGDLASYGHPTIRTPRLDQMARAGIRLTSFYVAASTCTPSRAGLLTGRYPPRTGITRVLLPSDSLGLPQSEVTLAEALKAAGYRTAAIGKWHLGHLPEFLPTHHGFDTFFGIPYSNDMMPPWVETAPPVPLMRDTRIVEQPAKQSTLTRRYTEEAIRVMREAKGAPFFIYLAYAMPHLPLHASDELRGRSRAGLYGDVIEELDWSAGQILAALRDLGLDRNTLVIFTSDNGPWDPAPQRMLRGGVERSHVGSSGHLRESKGSTYEGGFRVPAIVRWPGVIPAAQTSAEMASTLDLFTTLIRLSGGEPPSDRAIDGVDILPLLTGKAASPVADFFFFDSDSIAAVRQGRWKLRVAGGAPELFDLDVDPGERVNLAPQHPDTVARLRARIQSFR